MVDSLWFLLDGTPLRSSGAQKGSPHLLEVIPYYWGEGVGADPWRLRSLTGKGELRFWKGRALWAEGTTYAANGPATFRCHSSVSNAQNRVISFILENEGNFNRSSGVLPQDQGSLSCPWVPDCEFSHLHPRSSRDSLLTGGDQEKLPVRKGCSRALHATVGTQHCLIIIIVILSRVSNTG